MKKSSYKTVFTKYNVSVPKRLSRKTFSWYKQFRMRFQNRFPINEYENELFSDNNPLSDISSEMPKGFDYTSNMVAESFVDLKYLDVYDFLPKEEVGAFKKKLKHFAKRNKKPKFSPYRTEEDSNRIDEFERFMDGTAFTNLYQLEFSHNKFLLEKASKVSISIRNLSVSFACVRYRVYITEKFNKELNTLYKTNYEPSTDISRWYDTPWYKPRKFGKAYYDGDYTREKVVYERLSELKWVILIELRKYFRVFFDEVTLFPPVFETYSTNIRPNTNPTDTGFWKSIGLSDISDYSLSKNLCLGWSRDRSGSEGMCIFAVCGGKRYTGDDLPEIAEYYISDMFDTYLVAESMQRIANRDISICNKKISKEIRKGKSSRLLKVRTAVQKKLYYAYRFVSEFSGSTVEDNSFGDLRCPYKKQGSLSERMINNTPHLITETKQQIDSVLQLLSNAAEYESSKQNMRLQWLMFIFTVLAFVVAAIALASDWNTIKDFIFKFIDSVKQWLGD